MPATLQREHWNGQPTRLGELFVLHKERVGQQIEAICHLWTHHLGWEVRLEIAGDLHRSEVCRSQDEVFTAGETWKAAMIEKGWVA